MALPPRVRMRATGASVRISAPKRRAAPAIAFDTIAGAAARQAPRTEGAVDLAHVVVEQHVGRARRAHAEEGADDSRGAHRRLQHVGFEPLIQEVHGAHRQQLHLVDAVVVAHLLEAPADRQQLQQAARVERHRVGRGHPEDRLGEPAHLDHRHAVLVVRVGVEPAVPGDLASRLRVVVDAPQVVAARHRRERAVERQQLQPVAGQLEIADHLRAQQRDHIAAHRVGEAGEHLLADRGAAEHVAALEHQRLAPGAGEIRRAGQPVVAAADYHCVVAHAGQKYRWPAHAPGLGARDPGLGIGQSRRRAARGQNECQFQVVSSRAPSPEPRL